MSIVYVTSGAWGSGSGTPNSAAQVDGNFYNVDLRIEDLVTALAEGKRIESISSAFNAMTITFTDATTQVIQLPIASLNFVGAWYNSTPYVRGQLFTVPTLGLFQVLEDHTTPALPTAFDPNAVSDDTDLSPLYAFILPVFSINLPGGTAGQFVSKIDSADFNIQWSSLTADIVLFDPPTGSTLVSTNVADALEELAAGGSGGSLDGLSDVNVTEGSGINGYFLQWDNASSKWVAGAASSNLSGLADVNVTEGGGINGYFLQWDNGTSKWIAAASSSALSGLSDVNVTEGSGINGYFLKWSNGTSKWVASTIPLSGLSDVNVTEGSGINGYFLKWDNATSKWVASLSGATSTNLRDLSDVNVTEGSGINGYTITWNNGSSKWVATALGTAASVNTGTAGATIPLLNGTNSWSSTQTFTLAPVFTDASGSRTALGLGSAALLASSAVLQTANNLSEVTAATARSNLGLVIMTAAQYLANTASKVLTTDTLWSAAGTVTLTDAATVTMDFNTFINAKLTGTGGVGVTRTFGAASNQKVGQSGVIEWYPVTGALTLVIPAASSYVAAGGVSTLVLSATNGARDAIAYTVLNDSKILLSVQKGLSS